jgi:hypothetical protein
MKYRVGLLVALLFCVHAQLPQQATGSDQPAVRVLDSVGITVSNMNRSVDFSRRSCSSKRSQK